MNSKWLSHKRRSSLNHVEHLGHPSKLFTLQAPRNAENLSQYRSDSNLFRGKHSQNNSFDGGGTSQGLHDHAKKEDSGQKIGCLDATDMDRTESCDASHLRYFAGSPLLRASPRRSSLVTLEASPSVVLETAYQRRRSLCALSPVLASTPIEDSGHKRESFFRSPSLSPCVEDEFKEGQFLFSSYEDKLIPGHGVSDDIRSAVITTEEASQPKSGSCISGKTASRSSVFSLNFHPQTPSLTKRRQSIPTILINSASPESRSKSEVLEGFSLWLVEHVREPPKFADFFSSVDNTCSTSRFRKASSENINFLYGRNKRTCSTSPRVSESSNGRANSWLGEEHQKNSINVSAFNGRVTRRVSLQPHREVFIKSSRKLSAHLPRLQVPLPFPPHRAPDERRPLGAVLGRGGFGTVVLARFKGELVAVKRIYAGKTEACEDNERAALDIQPHPHLVTTLALMSAGHLPGLVMVRQRHKHKINEAELSWESMTRGLSWQEGDPAHRKTTLDLNAISCRRRASLSKSLKAFSSSWFVEQNKTWLWIVSELCSSSTLHTVVHSSLELSIKRKLRFLGELASGLAYLHDEGFIHRDVKPANAFLSWRGALKLGDFGCCGDLKGSLKPVIGTIPYQAPEILKGEVGSPKSDVFSLGVTMWHVLHRTVPYQGLHPHVVAYNVTRVGMRPDSCRLRSKHTEDAPTPADLDLLETMLATLARKCWHQNPKHRISTSSVCRSIAILYLTP